MKPSWHGMVPALSTATDNRGEFDEESQRNQVRKNIEWGVHGLAPSIMAGEFYKFTDEERVRCYEVVIDEANGKVPVIAGVSHSGTEPAVRLALKAKDLGADGIIVMAPYFGRGVKRSVLQRHIGTVARRCDLPIMIQDAEDVVGTHMCTTLYMDLADEYSNIVSVKVEGANTLEKIRDINRLMGDRLIVFGGEAARTVFEEIELGAKGNIPDACLTDLLVSVYENILAKRMNEARSVFTRYKVWLDFLSANSYAAAEIEKETLRLRGVLKSSHTRGPNQPLGDGEKRNLRELLKSIRVTD